MLPNTVLTVRQGEPGSHANQGWEVFTDAVIRAVNARSGRVVFLLREAHVRREVRLVTAAHHGVLEAGHPSPPSAARCLGSRPLSRANETRRQVGRGEVAWGLPRPRAGEVEEHLNRQGRPHARRTPQSGARGRRSPGGCTG